jgi:hypothetical protein
MRLESLVAAFQHSNARAIMPPKSISETEPDHFQFFGKRALLALSLSY